MKRGLAWPAAVVTILGLTVAANVWLIRVASTDPSFAVEERYYQRAIAWDDELAQRDANARLGWTTRTTVSPVTRDAGATLAVALLDRSGAPIANATITARVIAVARAGQPVAVTLRADPAGGYRARVALARPGLWEIRYDMRRGAEHFTAIERVDTHALAGE